MLQLPGDPGSFRTMGQAPATTAQMMGVRVPSFGAGRRSSSSQQCGLRLDTSPYTSPSTPAGFSPCGRTTPTPSDALGSSFCRAVSVGSRDVKGTQRWRQLLPEVAFGAARCEPHREGGWCCVAACCTHSPHFSGPNDTHHGNMCLPPQPLTVL